MRGACRETVRPGPGRARCGDPQALFRRSDAMAALVPRPIPPAARLPARAPPPRPQRRLARHWGGASTSGCSRDHQSSSPSRGRARKPMSQEDDPGRAKLCTSRPAATTPGTPTSSCRGDGAVRGVLRLRSHYSWYSHILVPTTGCGPVMQSAQAPQALNSPMSRSLVLPACRGGADWVTRPAGSRAASRPGGCGPGACGRSHRSRPPRRRGHRHPLRGVPPASALASRVAHSRSARSVASLWRRQRCSIWPATRTAATWLEAARMAAGLRPRWA